MQLLYATNHYAIIIWGINNNYILHDVFLEGLRNRKFNSIIRVFGYSHERCKRLSFIWSLVKYIWMSIDWFYPSFERFLRVKLSPHSSQVIWSIKLYKIFGLYMQINVETKVHSTWRLVCPHRQSRTLSVDYFEYSCLVLQVEFYAKKLYKFRQVHPDCCTSSVEEEHFWLRVMVNRNSL